MDRSKKPASGPSGRVQDPVKLSTTMKFMCVCLTVIIMAVVHPVNAKPDLSTLRQVHGISVCSDSEMQGRYYYLPAAVRLALTGDGAPDLKFVQMRYVGTRHTGDQGTIRYRNILRFRVIVDEIRADTLDAVRSALSRSGIVPDLRPMPVRRLETVLVYQRLRPDDSVDDEGQALGGDNVDTSAASGSSAGGYWTERNFTLRLDNETAQLFAEDLRAGRILLSVGYAFLSEVIIGEPTEVTLTGSPVLVQEMEENLLPDLDSLVDPGTECVCPVTASAFSIKLSLEDWPDLLEQFDVDARTPAGYPALDVYCYDFADSLRPDLYAKRVEIAAINVSGDTITHHITFRQSEPSVYARSTNFQYVVRLDQPYRYRIVEISYEEAPRPSEWITKESWAEILDITSRPE